MREYNLKNRVVLAAKSAEYRTKNREVLAARAAEYRAKNREQARAKTAQWRKDNPERQSASVKSWISKNREAYTAYQARYRVENRDRRNVLNKRRMQQVDKGDLTLAQWEQILYEFDHCCAYCQTRGKLQLEHMTPLSRGGQHTASNVVPACQPCNGRKHTRTIFEFLTL